MGGKSSTSASRSENNLCSPYPMSENERHEAAVKLQKVYKSFRIRRRLADCAVVVEQRWWKLLDFAELKRSSISFFDIEKPETANESCQGKGLSKDAKARKLALQHWLEAIDPRHRYGHNLQFYYVKWLQCESKQPFFFWLDIGEGKEVNHDRCSRSKLHQQCIKYLGPAERKAYEVVIENAKFMNKESGELLNTREGPKDAKWIFVLCTSKTLYVGQKNKGTFQHSSFLAGGATLSAGRLVVEDGVLKAVCPRSGHYLPTEENFQEFMVFLLEQGVDLTIVKKNSTEEEEEAISRKGDIELDSGKTDVENVAEENTASRLFRRLHAKITKLEIPTKDEMLEIFRREAIKHSCYMESPDSPSDEDYESAEDSFFSEEDFMLPKMALFKEDAEPIPREKILRWIDSQIHIKEQTHTNWPNSYPLDGLREQDLALVA